MSKFVKKQDDEDVFGTSEAARFLARELNNHAVGRTRQKVVTTMDTFCRGLNALNEIPDFHIRMALANVWMKQYFDNATVGKHTSKYNLETTLKNVIKFRFRLWYEKQPMLDYIHARQAGKKFTPAP